MDIPFALIAITYASCSKLLSVKVRLNKSTLNVIDDIIENSSEDIKVFSI